MCYKRCMTLRVVAHATARPDKIPETKALLQSLLGPTRQEAGCIAYEMLQDNANPAQFCFVEEWTNDAALDAHLKAPHIAAAFEKLPLLLEGNPAIGRYSLVG